MYGENRGFEMFDFKMGLSLLRCMEQNLDMYMEVYRIN